MKASASRMFSKIVSAFMLKLPPFNNVAQFTLNRPACHRREKQSSLCVGQVVCRLVLTGACSTIWLD
jgi:hypothetical protein